MSKSDRISIVYKEEDCCVFVKFKVRKKMKDKKYIFDKYWDDWSAARPHYIHEAWTKIYIKEKIVYKTQLLDDWTLKVIDSKKSKLKWIYKDPSYPDRPKLKKKKFYLHELKWWDICPSFWNNMFHTRPNRRAWKRFCKQVGRLQYNSYHDCEHQQWDGEGCIWDHWENLDKCQFNECRKFLEHVSEGIPYPSNKKHICYY